MKVTIAIDSFKGSLSSLEAGQAVADGIQIVFPDSEITIRPLADGGEGTVEALTLGMGGRLQEVTVTGPLGEPVNCPYGIVTDSDTKTAVIEMAGASGLPLVPPEKRNPLSCTTYGVGEVIRDAIAKGCRKFIIGIGGSATNDGGIGMLQALGYGILDKDGRQVSYGARGLSEIAAITDTGVIPELRECTFRIACDVTNPLCGDNGCSAVFGPQKGATPSMISQMDGWLREFASLTQKYYPDSSPEFPGSGAAGGLGFAFLTFTNAALLSGVDLILTETHLEEAVKDADLVVTGEGRLDGQTVMGKAPIGVAKIAKKYEKPVIAFSGCVTKDATACNKAGIDAFFPVLRTVTSLEDAMDPVQARENTTAAAEQVFRLIREISRKTR